MIACITQMYIAVHGQLYTCIVANMELFYKLVIVTTTTTQHVSLVKLNDQSRKSTLFFMYMHHPF